MLGWRQNGSKKARGKAENGHQGMLKVGSEPQGIRGWVTEGSDWDRGGLEKVRERLNPRAMVYRCWFQVNGEQDTQVRTV